MTDQACPDSTTTRCERYQENLENCPCASEDCPRKGICCECIAHHRSQQGKTACMR